MSGERPTPEEVDLVEFENLRHEINNRTNLAYALITLQLAALGAGLTAIVEYPDILLGLAAVSSFLWLFWVDHAGQVYKIASYIALELGPQLSRVPDRPVLRWEHFLRRIDSSRDSARMVLYRDSPPATDVYVQKSTSADTYSMLLFGCAPPLMIAGYVVTMLVNRDRPIGLVILLACVVTLLWLYAVQRFRKFRRTVTTIGKAILSRNPDGT
ncbi:hypothetical protein [Thermomonospora amylolytica]|uniref:hypothetical protein n=1 Tax=Thermomonospora amylolytica TaxID=1411117 RepID=UPI000E6C5ADB|nr:hypothetical protein [Thermomonospora amylolytica]